MCALRLGQPGGELRDRLRSEAATQFAVAANNRTDRRSRFGRNEISRVGLGRRAMSTTNALYDAVLRDCAAALACRKPVSAASPC